MDYSNHILNNTHRSKQRCDQERTRNEEGIIKQMTKNEENLCHLCNNRCQNEHGGEIYCVNVGRLAYKNQNFRESIWTGKYLQMTIMSIPCGEDIGVEIHCDTDQYIRIEQGNAILLTGNSAENLCHKCKLNTGDAVFIPAGTWHNIINAGRRPIKISSIYAPPHHPRCTVEKNKK